MKPSTLLTALALSLLVVTTQGCMTACNADLVRDALAAPTSEAFAPVPIVGIAAQRKNAHVIEVAVAYRDGETVGVRWHLTDDTVQWRDAGWPQPGSQGLRVVRGREGDRLEDGREAQRLEDGLLLVGDQLLLFADGQRMGELDLSRMEAIEVPAGVVARLWQGARAVFFTLALPVSLAIDLGTWPLQFGAIMIVFESGGSL